MNPVSIAVSVAIQAGLPVALRGKPGVGKTSMIEGIARDLNLHLEVVIGSVINPSKNISDHVQKTCDDSNQAPLSLSFSASPAVLVTFPHLPGVEEDCQASVVTKHHGNEQDPEVEEGNAIPLGIVLWSVLVCRIANEGGNHPHSWQ